MTAGSWRGGIDCCRAPVSLTRLAHPSEDLNPLARRAGKHGRGAGSLRCLTATAAPSSVSGLCGHYYVAAPRSRHRPIIRAVDGLRFKCARYFVPLGAGLLACAATGAPVTLYEPLFLGTASSVTPACTRPSAGENVVSSGRRGTRLSSLSWPAADAPPPSISDSTGRTVGISFPLEEIATWACAQVPVPANRRVELVTPRGRTVGLAQDAATGRIWDPLPLLSTNKRRSRASFVSFRGNHDSSQSRTLACDLILHAILGPPRFRRSPRGIPGCHFVGFAAFSGV